MTSQTRTEQGGIRDTKTSMAPDPMPAGLSGFKRSRAANANGSSFWTLRWGLFLLEALDENLFPCLSLLLQAAHTPWLLQQHQAESFSRCHCSGSPFQRRRPLLGTLVIILNPLGPSRILSLFERQLISSLNFVCSLISALPNTRTQS